MIKTETIENVVRVYQMLKSIDETASRVGLSSTKVRKILITEDLWSSPRSREIRELYDQGKSSAEIAETLQISTVMVQNYLPYEKGLYGEDEKTDTALRSEQYRQRNQAAVQKSQAREDKKPKQFPAFQESKTAVEKKKPYAMLLHLELLDSRVDSLSDEEARIFGRYGRVRKSLSRDIIVPSSFTLHQLHYLINRAFGWTNSHLHDFQLPQPLFEELTKGKFLDFSPIFGYYLQFPNSTFSDAFWDDDYDGSKSIRSWLRSKYRKAYRYGGHSEYWIENQVTIQNLVDQHPVLTVDPWWSLKEPKPRRVKIEDATYQEVMSTMHFDDGVQDILKESLRLSEILSLDPIDIKTARATALEIDDSDFYQYKQYRKAMIADDLWDASVDELSPAYRTVTRMDRLRKKAEPKDVQPLTSKLEYNYDYGDGWKVDISLLQEFGKDNQEISDEKASEVIARRKPICIAKDGLNVLDDCGNVHGYIDMLYMIYEDGDLVNAREMKKWARWQGWTGRNISPENVV